jgi:hypothetical protein
MASPWGQWETSLGRLSLLVKNDQTGYWSVVQSLVRAEVSDKLHLRSNLLERPRGGRDAWTSRVIFSRG